MRRTSRVLPAFALATLAVGAVLPRVASAQDSASLEAALVDYYNKLNNEDPAFADYFLPGGDQFPRTGTLIQTNAADPALVRANFEAGLDFNAALHHFGAQIFGDTGIATYYTTGATTYPDGTVLPGTYRASIVAIWQGNQWRWAHLHLSELKTAPE